MSPAARPPPPPHTETETLFIFNNQFLDAVGCQYLSPYIKQDSTHSTQKIGKEVEGISQHRKFCKDFREGFGIKSHLICLVQFDLF